MPTMPAVETYRVSGQEPAHHRGDGKSTRPQKQVNVIWDKCPCKTRGFAFGQNDTCPIQKITSVGIIEKNLSSINSPHDDMVQSAEGGSIRALRSMLFVYQIIAFM